MEQCYNIHHHPEGLEVQHAILFLYMVSGYGTRRNNRVVHYRFGPISDYGIFRDRCRRLWLHARWRWHYDRDFDCFTVGHYRRWSCGM